MDGQVKEGFATLKRAQALARAAQDGSALGVSGRMQAAALAERAGLLPSAQP